MIDLSPEAVTIIMFGALLVGVLLGVPLAIIIGAIALGMGFIEYGTSVGSILYPRVFAIMTKYVLLAVPLFIFMGGMLERSGITEKMYDALYLWLGGLRGGLSIITIIIGTILAATVGIIAASITMLALVALPAMMKRGYSKSFASGAVTAGGCLGILIPPSVMLILDIGGEAVYGRLFPWLYACRFVLYLYSGSQLFTTAYSATGASGRKKGTYH